MALSKTNLANIPAPGRRKDAPYKLGDGGGLYIHVTQTSLLWRYKYRLKRPGQPDDGKEKLASFGEYSPTRSDPTDPTKADFDTARQRHLAARQRVADGGDPAAEAKDAKQAQRASDQEEQVARRARRPISAKAVRAKPVKADGPALFPPGTFGYAAAGLTAVQKKQVDLGKRSQKTHARDERMARYCNNSFGKVALQDIEVAHLAKLLDVFEGEDKFATRIRIQSAAVNTMGFAQAKGWIKHSPLLGIRFGAAYTAPLDVPRPAIIEAERFGKLLRDVAGYRGRQGNLVGIALTLTNLTFVRDGNIVNAEWDEFDFDEAMWTIPFKKLKQRKFREGVKELKGKPHYVPLSKQAVNLLRKLKTLSGDSKWLFPALENGSGHVTTEGLESAINSLGYKNVHCPHGFRSSASTMLNRERIIVGEHKMPRFAEQVIEFQLEHVDKKVAAIYNRDQRLDERIYLMQHWANMCDAMRDDKTAKAAKFKVVA
jgi:integrase